MSPGSSSPSAMWPMPSFAPMSDSASVAGSSSTPKRLLYHPATASSELRQALGLRVAVVRPVVRSLLQLFQHGVGCRKVGVADAEGDDTLALGPLGRDAPGDLHEKIGRKLLDTLRELHVIPSTSRRSRAEPAPYSDTGREPRRFR